MTRRGWRPPVPMAEAVTQTLERLGLATGVRQRELWRVWGDVVGPQIARHAQPWAITRGRLIVHVTDPVWLHQLSMMRHRLVATLSESLGESVVREIVLRIGEVEDVPSVEPSVPPTDAPIDAAHRAVIRELVSSLGDAPCCDALERLMIRASTSRKAPGK
ncbi:MAG: DUF721 domain-containing protein [candidate division NC10 bacterium]|nr:DUF721 domain-containing protein [candidate division NC10 bacterium]